MLPSTHPVPDDPSPTPSYFRIEAESHITKEVTRHIVRAPDGEVLSLHARLGHAFDVLYTRGVNRFVLESEDWEVLVDLDLDGSLTQRLGDPSHG